MKRKVFFPVLAVAIIAAGLMSTNFVSAQDTASANSLVSAIAQKFNLSQADVQAVFDEEHSKRGAEMKAQMELKLTQAVTDGKITEAQKQAIVSHFGEMKSKKLEPGQLKNLTDDEMKAFKESKKAEMDNWLSKNGLAHETLQEVMGHSKGMGGRKMFIAH